ncbi:hypothetical protein D3C85_1449880 [compost metagenome]
MVRHHQHPLALQPFGMADFVADDANAAHQPEEQPEGMMDDIAARALAGLGGPRQQRKRREHQHAQQQATHAEAREAEAGGTHAPGAVEAFNHGAATSRLRVRRGGAARRRRSA